MKKFAVAVCATLGTSLPACAQEPPPESLPGLPQNFEIMGFAGLPDVPGLTCIPGATCDSGSGIPDPTKAVTWVVQETIINPAGELVKVAKNPAGAVSRTIETLSGNTIQYIIYPRGGISQKILSQTLGVISIASASSIDFRKVIQTPDLDTLGHIQGSAGDGFRYFIDRGGLIVDIANGPSGDVFRNIRFPDRSVLFSSTLPNGEFVSNVEDAAGLLIEQHEKLNGDIETTIWKAAKDVSGNFSKAGEDVSKTLSKAGIDTQAELGRTLVNVADAGRAIERFQAAQLNANISSITAAEQRIREGKIVDALWGIGVEPLQATDNNAARALQESTYLATVAQVAATAYGGPYGAAAYAAWYTYKQTGDAELAFRVGVLTGASSAAMGAAGKMPSDTSGELARKTIVSGAIGGLAAAAAGGDENAIKDAAFNSAAAVLVQDGYRRLTHSELNARGSVGEGYCMLADPNAIPKPDCLPPEAAYERDSQGNIVKDPDTGLPKVDVKKTDPSRPHVGLWASVDGKPQVLGERSGFMTAVSRVPGMNAMAFAHDEFAVTWKTGLPATVATIPPAIVITYIGTGAPYYKRLQETAVATWERDKYRSYSGAPVEPYPGQPVVTGQEGERIFGNVTPFKRPKNITGAPLLDSHSYEASSYLCPIGAEPRTVIVERPREKADFVCKVRYLKQGSLSTPWIARNDTTFCAKRAAELASKLSKASSCLYRGP